MSRVHDALRRAEQNGPLVPQPAASEAAARSVAPPATLVPVAGDKDLVLSPEVLRQVKSIPFTPSPDSHLMEMVNAHESPAEEFRTIRTRLNHMQSTQPIHTLVVTSASPAEGKSFAAANLAIAQSQLEGNSTLLIDCDFRRPIVHSLFGMNRGPGMTDYLQGKAPLTDCIYRIGTSGLFIIPAGEPVVNPLELLNLNEMKVFLERLPKVFRWTVVDSPPLLFAADANLLSTMCSGVVLVVRIGTTTVDSVTRAMQSLCEDNVIGTIVNGARRGELYSKYTYYHSYYYAGPEAGAAEDPVSTTVETVPRDPA